MKATGIVRQMDELGRVVIPMELRRTLGLEDHAAMEILVEGDIVMMRRYQPGCTLCGSMKDLVHNHPSGKRVCRQCLTA